MRNLPLGEPGIITSIERRHASHPARARVSAALAMATLVAVFGGFASAVRAEGVVTQATEEALINAVAGGGLVTFATNITSAITLTGPIQIAAGTNTIIDAEDHTITISGGKSTRIFTVSSNLTLRGLILTGGASENGGAVLVGSNAVLHAQDCLFAGNTAAGANGTAGADGGDRSSGLGGNGSNGISGRQGRGGAIFNSGTVTLVNCTLLTNSASGGNGGKGGSGGDSAGTLGQGGEGGDGGAGALAYGGAVFNSGNLTLTNCAFRGNTANGGDGGTGGVAGGGTFAGLAGRGGAGGGGYGGAIFNALNITILSSAFWENMAAGGDSPAGGTQSNLNGQRGYDGGEAGGGGLCNSLWGAVTNCTFYTNTVRGGKGGDGGVGTGSLSVRGDGGDGGDGIGGGVQSWATLTLVNCTLVNNGAYGGTNGVANGGTNGAGGGTFSGEDGRFGNAYGGNISAGSSSARATMQGTLVGSAVSGYPGSGTFIDEGYNMSPDNSLGFGSKSFPNTSPLRLGIFGDHGGPTPTLPLLAGSPAVDKIPPSFSPAYDQRGTPRPRPAGKKSDIGAFEMSASNDWLPAITAFTRDPTNSEVSVGTTVTFTVKASGDTPLHYEWRMNETNILEGATTNFLTLTDVQFTDEGAYDVVVTNTFGSVTSSVATLVVTMEVGGSVQDGTNGLPGVLVTFRMGGTNGVLITDTEGRFSDNVRQGTWTITPSLTNYLFNPSSVIVDVPPGSNNIVFAAAPVLRIGTQTNGNVRLSSAGVSNALYTILGSTDLTNWETVATSTNGVLFVQPSTNAQRFFKITR